MGKARRIVLSTRAFEKAGDATTFFSSMLNRYSVGDRVSDTDALDLTALIQRHEEMVEKVGSGIDHFEVRLPPTEAPPFSSKCFWIVKTVGDPIDISYKHCLEPRPYD